ncbi:MAG: hypothetical protein BMS9Abin18_0746 [Zetaproteobacteria bacterium]|nr:MAG: hypothetical protein BMS9Abin18_0746 [Zetaproteobacteria bacterium]
MGRPTGAAQLGEAWTPSIKSAIFTFLTNQHLAVQTIDLRAHEWAL